MKRESLENGCWRAAAGPDEDTVLTLMAEFYAEEGLVFDSLIARRALHELLGNAAWGRVMLLQVGAGTAGYVAATTGFSLEFHGRYVLLDELYVQPAVRGRGWGRNGLDQVAAWAGEIGAATVRLEVNHHNARAKAVYLKSGFSDDRRDLLTRWLKPSA